MKRIKLSTVSIIIGVFILTLSIGPLLKDELWFYYSEFTNKKFVLSETAPADSPFAALISKEVTISPPDKDFSIIIERIGVSAPVIRDVSVFDSNAYKAALKEGVAHSASSPYPSPYPGNVYLFAHASVNFWELGKYANVFNLLRKLDEGDLIHVFYEGDDYIYQVISKEVVKGWDTTPLVLKYIEPVLTLQTCDPPGTTLNRLVVTSKLVRVNYDLD